MKDSISVNIDNTDYRVIVSNCLGAYHIQICIYDKDARFPFLPSPKSAREYFNKYNITPKTFSVISNLELEIIKIINNLLDKSSIVIFDYYPEFQKIIDKKLSMHGFGSRKINNSSYNENTLEIYRLEK